MPANALRVKERKFSTFEAVVDGQSVQIQGEYEVTIVNNGLLRVPSVTVSLSELSLPNGSVKIIEEEKTKSIGTLGRGQTGKVKFEFQVSGSSSALRQFAGTACRSQKPVLTSDERYSGLILALASSGKVEVESPSPSCSRAGGLPDQPEDVEPPEEPPSGEGGQEPPEQEPPQEQPPEQEPAPQPPSDGQEMQQVNISGPTSPEVGESATYSVSNPPSSASEYVWNVTGAPFDQSSPADDNEYVASFPSAGTETVAVDVRNDIGNQVGQGQLTVNIQESRGSGADEPDGGDTGNGGSDGNDSGGQITGPEIVVEGQSNEWNYTGDLSEYNSQDHRKIWDMSVESNRDEVEQGGPFTTGTVVHTYDFPGPKTIEFRVESQFTDEVLESARYDITVEDSGLGAGGGDDDDEVETPVEEPDPPQNGGGDDGEDDNQDGGDTGGGAGNIQEGNIAGPSVVVEGSENTWEYTGDLGGNPSLYDIQWSMGDGETYAGSLEVSHTYDFQGPQTIQFTVNAVGAAGPNQRVVDETLNVDVEPDVSGGPIGGLSFQPPSMSEAANNKEREY